MHALAPLSPPPSPDGLVQDAVGDQSDPASSIDHSEILQISVLDFFRDCKTMLISGVHTLNVLYSDAEIQ